MKIVQFSNGKWAIQRGWINKEYKSRYSSLWWGETHIEEISQRCLFDTKKEALDFAEILRLKVIHSEKV